jgi:hypothetical protein
MTLHLSLLGNNLELCHFELFHHKKYNFIISNIVSHPEIIREISLFDFQPHNKVLLTSKHLKDFISRSLIYAKASSSFEQTESFN